MTQSTPQAHPMLTGKRLITSALMAGAGAVCGAGLAFTVTRLAPKLNWADNLALTVSLFCMGTALVLGVVSLNPAALGRALKLDAPADPDETATARRQAIVLGLAGFMLIAPPLVAARGADPRLSFAAILALFVLQTVFNLRLWRRGDELVRRMIVEAGAASFWLLQACLFLYAAAERIGLAPPATAWQAATVMMAAYVVISNIIGFRRIH